MRAVGAEGGDVKAPAWLKIEIGGRPGDGGVFMTVVSVRLWHPGFWLWWGRMWWAWRRQRRET